MADKFAGVVQRLERVPHKDQTKVRLFPPAQRKSQKAPIGAFCDAPNLVKLSTLIPIKYSQRVRKIEEKWGKPATVLLREWHWKDNLKHGEIATKLQLPRPTITRWFHRLGIPSQSSKRFTNLNLLNIGPIKTPPAKPKVKKEFPWKYKKDFFKTWSREMAYLLGFIAADGYVWKNPRGSNYLGFTSTDEEIIIKIRKLLGSNHKIGERNKHLKNPSWKKAFVLQIGGKEIVNDLRKYGIIQNKSLVIKFPKIPPKYLGDYVRGYFDGDGGVHLGRYKRKNRNNSWAWTFSVDFTSGSKIFLVDLLKTLNKNISGGFIYDKNGSGYSFCFSRRDSVALFELMYNNVTSEMFLERKYNTFLKAFRTLNYKVAGVA